MLISIITDRAPFHSHTITHAFPQCFFPSGLTVVFSYSMNNGRIGHKSAGVCAILNFLVVCLERKQAIWLYQEIG